jgi:hypothetical protein
VVGHQLRGYPVTSAAKGVADQGQASMSFSRWVLHMDPCPWPALSKAADATGYPHPSCPAAAAHLRVPVTLLFVSRSFEAFPPSVWAWAVSADSAW